MTTLLIIAVLIALNAIFVAAEFAIVGAPRAAIDARAARKQPLARLVQSVLRDPRRQDRYIATAQIGITVASLGLGMYGEHVLADWVLALLGHATGRSGSPHTGSRASSRVAILTYFHIVLGEMVPKSLALSDAEQIALWITPPMLWIQTLLLPLVVALERHRQPRSEIRRHQTGRAEHRSVLHVRGAAAHRPGIRGAGRAAGRRRADAARAVRVRRSNGRRGHGSASTHLRHSGRIDPGAAPRHPAIDTAHALSRCIEGDLDHISACSHQGSAAAAAASANRSRRAGVRQAPVVPETSPLDDVLTSMRRERTQMAVVIDEHGGTAGIVTLEDLFEEVVGEIEEGPHDPAGPQWDATGRLRVPGTMRLDELGRFFDLDLAHEDVDSVSGLTLTLLGRPPRVGDSVRYERLRFDVTAVKGRGVDEAAVSLVE